MSACRQNPVEQMAQLTKGQQDERETGQAGTQPTVAMLCGSPDHSILLQYLPVPFSYQISVPSVTIGRCHTNHWPLAHLTAGCHSQTARHHALTFMENDPNRWPVPNTNNGIKPPDKVRKGEHLAFLLNNQNSYRPWLSKQQANPLPWLPSFRQCWLNRKTEHQSSHFTSKEPPIALT